MNNGKYLKIDLEHNLIFKNRKLIKRLKLSTSDFSIPLLSYLNDRYYSLNPSSPAILNRVVESWRNSLNS